MKRVFVLWKHSLFYDSVRLLLRHPQVQLVGDTSDYSAWQDQISGLQPDVVIIEEGDHEDMGSSHPVRLLFQASTVMRLSLADNELSVYQPQNHTVAKADELLNLILEQPSHDLDEGQP